MKIHFFQHVPFEGLGIIEEWIHVKGYELTATRFFNGEKSLPLNRLTGLLSWVVQ